METKDQILRFLKQLGRMSTSRFVGVIGINYEKIKMILEEMNSEELIKKEEETNSTYWIITKKGEIEIQ